MNVAPPFDLVGVGLLVIGLLIVLGLAGLIGLVVGLYSIYRRAK